MTEEARNDPFAMTASVADYVPRPALEAALAALSAALEGGAPVVLLSGPAGLGKTLLLRRLEAEWSGRRSLVSLPYAALPIEDLAAWALGVLGRPTGGEPLRTLAAVAREGAPLVLVLDDGSAIPLATARRLATLASETDARLSVVVAMTDDGKSETVCAALGDAARIVRLDTPMSAAESAAYVAARLARAEADPEVRGRFDAVMLDRLYRASRGVPRVLHRLASEVVRRGRSALSEVELDEPALESEAALWRGDEGPPATPAAARVAVLAAEAAKVDAGLSAPEPAPVSTPPRVEPPAPRMEPVAPKADPVAPRPAPPPAPAVTPPVPEPLAPKVEPVIPKAEPVAKPPVAVAPPEPTPPRVEQTPPSVEPVAPKVEPVAPKPAPPPPRVTPPIAESPKPTPRPAEPPPAAKEPEPRKVPPPKPAEPVAKPPVAAAPADPTPPSVERSEPRPATAKPAAVRPAKPAAEGRAPAARPAPSRNIGPLQIFAVALVVGAAAVGIPLLLNRVPEPAATPAQPPAAGPAQSPPAAPTRSPADAPTQAPAAVPVVRPATVLPKAAEPAVPAPPPPRPPDLPAVAPEPAPEAAAAPVPEPEPAAAPVPAEPTPAPPAPEIPKPAAEAPKPVPVVPPAVPSPTPTPAPEIARPVAPAPEPPKPALPPVSVAINAMPWAVIEIDGREVGETPLAGVMLAPGSHVFRARMPDDRVVTRTVEIDPENRFVTFP